VRKGAHGAKSSRKRKESRQLSTRRQGFWGRTGKNQKESGKSRRGYTEERRAESSIMIRSSLQGRKGGVW